MKLHKRIVFLLPTIIMSLACQTVMGVVSPTATLSPTVTLMDTVTATLQPDTPTPSPTIPPTETPVPTATLAFLAKDGRLEIFEKLWNIINDYYIYKDFNGVDWDAVHEEYYAKVIATNNPELFYDLLNEMIALLNDEHSGLLNPREVAQEEMEFAGENQFVGIGVLTQAVYERGYATVLLTFPNSPAEKAGIKAHDNILRADGYPIIQDDQFMIDHLRGLEGTQVTVEVQTPGEEVRQLTLTRKKFKEATPVPYQVLTTPDGKRVGYILVVTFADITIDVQISDALYKMTVDSPLDGVIIDNRMNTGGADTIAKGTLKLFTDGTLGYFYDRNDQRRDFAVEAEDVGGSQHVPLVVIVGKGTASFGELFAGVLKNKQRAYIIGETTDGNVELLRGYDFEDGSRAWIAHEKFRPIYNPDDDWEESGIIPDLTVLSDWDLVTTENDPVVVAALEYFDSN
ncbi:MAG: PDZ domain-containing protein [Anaerolineales bacterium]|nr:PDZ domain-containing protein [Anaerolineales bacterium]